MLFSFYIYPVISPLLIEFSPSFYLLFFFPSNCRAMDVYYFDSSRLRKSYNSGLKTETWKHVCF